jgi:chromosome segregation ATPase
MDNKLESRANPELENELEALKKQNKELEEKLNSKPAATGMDPQKELEFLKLTEIKALYENKMKEQVAEIKKLEARVKVLTTQIESLVKKLTTAPAAGGASPAAAITPGKTNDNHAKQLEHASNRVAEVTREFNDKKKEVIQVKQENAKLNSQIYELLKKIQYYEKKAG